jgi:energy-coupling factor transporter ATP-binding protein EcfA2
MAFKQAERTQLWLRCALFGPSGSGKTMTALRMAKGMADKTGGQFAVIDTEARSASKYSDRIPFIVDDLERKTVDDYINSMHEAARMGYQVLVIDSLSHAWRELTDEVDRIAQASTSKNTFSPWAKVNPKQKRFIDAILNFPGHIIATMRSKTEWVIGENRNGKTAPEKLGLAPEQGKGIEYEFDLLIELNQRHQALVTKDRTGKFQDETIDKPGEDFGILLCEWLAGGKAKAPPMPETVPETAMTNPAPATTATEPAKRVSAKTRAAAKPLPPATNPFKERGNQIVKELGALFNTVDKEGKPCFTEEEKAEGRNIITTTRLDETCIRELEDFKGFIAEELNKRKIKKAA